MPTRIGSSNVIIHAVSIPMARARVGNDQVYPNGAAVTYHVDSNLVYTEEIDSGESCLSPKTFAPAKDGWEFVGWRTDAEASGDVLSSLVMEDDPIALYAVFRQTVILTYYNGSAAKQTSTGYKYYNNGNIVNPRFTVAVATVPGFTFRGWSTSNVGSDDITYPALNNTDISTSTTLYGLYQQTITLTYNGNGSTSGSVEAQTGIRYYSSAGTYINPAFVLSNNSYARSGATFLYWAIGSVGGTTYTAGKTVTLTASTVFYAKWQLANTTIPISSAFGSDYYFSIEFDTGFNSNVTKTLYAIDTSKYSGFAIYIPKNTMKCYNASTGGVITSFYMNGKIIRAGVTGNSSQSGTENPDESGYTTAPGYKGEAFTLTVNNVSSIYLTGTSGKLVLLSEYYGATLTLLGKIV